VHLSTSSTVQSVGNAGIVARPSWNGEGFTTEARRHGGVRWKATFELTGEEP
jgi:hypothetical protein